MKLPASVLAALCLSGVAGCETTVDFERRSAPPTATEVVAEKGKVERVEIELGRIDEERRFAKPPPGAAPIAKPTPVPKPTIRPKVVPKPQPKPQAHVCGPCGMG